MDKPTIDLKGKTCLVTAKWSIFYGKEVEVISSADLIIDGQLQWNCICKDGSGGGMLPQNILIPMTYMSKQGTSCRLPVPHHPKIRLSKLDIDALSKCLNILGSNCK